MYLNILFIPFFSVLFGFIFSNFLGRRGILSSILFFMLLTLALVYIGFWDLFITNTVICYDIFPWIHLGSVSINWIFLFDSLTISMLLIVVTISFLVHVYSVSYMRNDPYIVRFFIYLTLFTLFMIILVTSGNLLMLFVGWEGVGLCSFLLISFWFTRKEANKSAIKAMVINRIGDFGIIISIVYLIDIFSDLNFFVIYSLSEVLSNTITNNEYWLVYLICVGLLIGAVGKSSQIGLHTWLPDAMEGPTPVSALIHAATMVTAGVFIILRCSVLFELVPEVLFYIIIIGSLTALMAATIGLAQNDIKKIIAYSTCSQLGYMIFSCGVSNYSVSLFHLVNHAFFKALLFLGAGVVIHALLEEQDIRRMGGLINYLPFTYSLFLISSFSLIGFPFLSGYYSKDFLIELSYLSFSFSGYFSFLVGSIVAGITAFYSFKLIYFVFLGNVNFSLKKLYNLHAFDFYNGSALIFLIIGSIFSGYFLKELFLGFGTAFWNTSLFFNEFNSFYNNLFAMPIFYKLFPFFLSMLGLFSVFIFYWGFSKVAFNLFFLPGVFPIYLFLNKAWYFNNIYNYFIGEKALHLSFNTMYKLIDKGILEYFGPLGITTFFKNTSSLILSINSGKFYHYILMMFYFVVLFLMFYITFFIFI